MSRKKTKRVAITRDTAVLLLSFEEDVRHHDDLWPDYERQFGELRRALGLGPNEPVPEKP